MFVKELWRYPPCRFSYAPKFADRPRLLARRSRLLQAIGIRIALGAPLAVIRGQFQRQGVGLAAVGLAIGLGAFFALRKVIATQPYEVAAMEPSLLAGVAVLLGVAALGATTVPAWRAARIDPIETLWRE